MVKLSNPFLPYDLSVVEIDWAVKPAIRNALNDRATPNICVMVISGQPVCSNNQKFAAL
jgi:hypothetical protein